jgi:hypothetical protein
MTKKAKMGRPKLTEKDRGKVLSFWATPALQNKVNQIIESTGDSLSGYLRDTVGRATSSVLEEYKSNQTGEASPNHHYPERDKNEIPKTTN